MITETDYEVKPCVVMDLSAKPLITPLEVIFNIRCYNLSSVVLVKVFHFSFI